jgi:hypothetical protein
MNQTIRQAEYDIATLTERIAENEVIYGPGCRPELRERLAAAHRRLAAVQADADATARQRFTLQKIRITAGGAVHLSWGLDYGATCGALPAGRAATYIQHLGATDAYRLAGSQTCGRCRKSVDRWWNEP